MGEEGTRREYLRLFESGKAYADRELFNGEYYYQKVDLDDRSILERFGNEALTLHGNDAVKEYWLEEKGELKYQIGEGCGIDQVLAQWHSDLIGLGDIFDPTQVSSALRSIYRYNFIPNMRRHVNPCRLYSMNDEGGLTICAWPAGKRKPHIPAPYSQETMNGFEYAAASHMILHGMVEEGMACVSALRRRYDGRYRNPWNEFECGSNYARSMASYALLLAFSGMKYDMHRGMLGFSPICENGRFFAPWSLQCAWGTVSFQPGAVRIAVCAGELSLTALNLKMEGHAPKTVLCDGRKADFEMRDGEICFTRKQQVNESVCIAY